MSVRAGIGPDYRRAYAAAQALGLGLRGRRVVGRAAARRRAGPRGAPADRRRRRGARARRARRRRAAGAARRRRRPSSRAICASDTHARASHAWGKSYADVVRGFHGRFDFPPDVVARPRGERDVEAVLEWAAGANVAVVPYGGGTSVSGGVQCEVPERFDGAVSLDLGAMDRVLQIDDVSRAACIQAGASGPRARAPAARARPDAALLPAVLRAVDARRLDRDARRRALRDRRDAHRRPRRVRPRGHAEPARGSRGGCPGSGAGPSPDRMLLGSEGILGVITEAWVRVRPRPQAHSLAAVRFARLRRTGSTRCARSRSRACGPPTAA